MIQNSKFKILHSQKGVAALITIVIVAAAALIMAYSASLIGMGELDLGYTAQKGDEAFSFTDGCLNEAYHRLSSDPNYTGGSLSVSEGSCIISVTGSGNNRNIVVTGTVDEYHKKIQADIIFSGNNLTVTSWQEVSD